MSTRVWHYTGPGILIGRKQKILRHLQFVFDISRFKLSALNRDQVVSTTDGPPEPLMTK
jgi:hypothetical protein